MEPDIKRRTELFLVGLLATILPDEKFYPFSGGDETKGAEEIEPPFTIISVTTANRTMATEGTWLCEGKVQILAHHTDMTSEDQAIRVRKIYAAVSNLTPQANPIFTFHGIDIGNMESADDDASQCHADVINFTAGVGG